MRPLSTEGQVFGKAEGEVLGLTATIPFGLGLRMGLGSFWRLGIEASYIKTFTDYIDDVHGKYFDPAILASEIGPEAGISQIQALKIHLGLLQDSKEVILRMMRIFTST